MSEPKKGDWVRFYRGGVLVIGIIQYITHKNCIGKRDILTDAGSVSEDSILEARREIKKVEK